MKNIHILPTDKPSRLYKIENKLGLREEPNRNFLAKNQHIYITSDEEVKEDDWIIWNKKVVQAVDTTYYSAKKIILTTDLTLIADGVRAIDDIFLEWFVENLSCEEIKVELHEVSFVITDNIYKIIIPKEEPKQEISNEAKERAKNYMRLKGSLEPKQETLEEAALRLYPKFSHDPYNPLEDVLEDEREIFIEGAEWQAERMYSEEDMKSAYFSAIESTGEGWNGEYAEGNNPNIEDKFSEEFKEWFEQFKKKGDDK